MRCREGRKALMGPTELPRNAKIAWGSKRRTRDGKSWSGRTPAEHKSKKPSSNDEGFSNSSLTMSYFHTGTRTIIGAEAFHCPVRDGKEWDHLAMVIRLNRSPSCT